MGKSSRIMEFKTGQPVSISWDGADGKILVVYIKLREGSVARTIELDPEVYADLDAQGEILGIEFAEPESYNIELMGELTRKHHLPPALSAFAPSRLAGMVAG